MGVSAALDRLYSQVPTFKCIDGCGDCCGMVPWAPEEFARVKDRLPPGTEVLEFESCPMPVRTGTTECAFFDHGCSVYPDRPFMCRLFGTARDHRMTCPHGCASERQISREQARGMTNRYKRLAC